MKAIEKEIAVSLRKKGKTFSEILKYVDVSKGTLSLWLRNVELPDDYIEKIKGLRERAIEKSANAVREKWTKKYYEIRKNYVPLYDDPFYMLGLGIYMGEGSKYLRCVVGLSNSDARILIIYKRWIENFFVEKTSIWRGSVYVHDKNNCEKAKKWWAETLGISIESITKPIVCISRASKRKRRTLKYGTFELMVGGKNTWKVACKIKKAMDFAPVV